MKHDNCTEQTTAISTAIVSEHTTPENRPEELSRLTAATTLALIVGPSLGSTMYQRSKMLPPLVRWRFPDTTYRREVRKRVAGRSHRRA